MKDIYALQPYEVGSKNGKSLALVIPAKVAKKYHIDTSTIFSLRADERKDVVTIQTTKLIERISKNLIPKNNKFEELDQQLHHSKSQQAKNL